MPTTGEGVKLGFGSDLPPGVTEGTDNETTITIVDDDPLVAVDFDESTYFVDEGESVTVTVTLNADPMRTLVIPITASNRGGATSADYDRGRPA